MVAKSLLIPAAGAGTRMRRATPKPYLKLDGLPILEHTIRRFLSLEGLGEVIISTSEEYLEFTRELLRGVLPETLPGRCVLGGASRQQSIYNALQESELSGLVLVHDAVRPFVKLSHIEACCKIAQEQGGAVLGVPVRDTIKRVDDDRLVLDTPKRSELWQSQTPQVFKKAVLEKAYERARADQFNGTDDASLVERLGEKVQMVQGDFSNFKLTYPLDLRLAELLVKEHSFDE